MLIEMRLAYSQIAYGKLCARVFNYPFGRLGLWLRFGILGSVDPILYPYPNPNTNSTLTLLVNLTPNIVNIPWLNPTPTLTIATTLTLTQTLTITLNPNPNPPT